MANMASVAYAIEGSEESLKWIQQAIKDAIESKESFYEEYLACKNLGFLEKELENKRLGGEISDIPELDNGVLHFWAEERWGLQNFNELLEKKFPGIKVYWRVEECGCGLYCTNDKEGVYFPERYWVDTCIDGEYQSEYFITEKGVYDWLEDITKGRVKNEEDVNSFNSDYEDSDACDENFIYIHKFDVED